MFVAFRWPVMAMVCVVAVLAACSPALNWRELRLEGTPLLALMPCKPESAARSVPMLGQPTELHMHSCETGGLTFAVAWAELADGSRADEAMDQWQAASLAAIRVTPEGGQPWDTQLTGVTTQRGVSAKGTDYRGQPVQSQAAYFVQGNKVYQAAVYGPKIAPEASTGFFEGLSLQ